jgi:hypothetical protein
MGIRLCRARRLEIVVGRWTNGQKRYERTYVNDMEHGLDQWWNENGQKVYECTYVNGNINGLQQRWYENGQKQSECTYVNDKQHGLSQWWYANGQKESEYTYVNGVIHGIAFYWNPDGTLYKINIFESGETTPLLFRKFLKERMQPFKEALVQYNMRPERVARCQELFGEDDKAFEACF